jgi:peptidoglycan/xylan/chitin deacetylase (PgdA/CDA1 family)
VVALTFDDGPHQRYTDRIASLLDRRRVRATFFVWGERLERNRQLGEALHRAGHQLANHTYRHNTGRDLFNAERLTEDLQRCQQAICSITGASPRYYRPAVGVRNPSVHRAAAALGLRVVTWSHAARDGLFALTEKRAVSLGREAGAGSILVLHDGARDGESAFREATVRHLPALLERLEGRGLTCVTLEELLDPRGRA